MKRQTKEQARAHWMRLYAEKLIQLRPELVGRIDWDAATYYFLNGTNPTQAACRFADNHPTGKA